MGIHTPGPWKVVDRFYVWTDDDVGCEVAKVCDENLDEDSLEQADADARLIAAAPELLAACREAVSAITYLLSNDDDDPNYADTLNTLAAAISKAEGMGE